MNLLIRADAYHQIGNGHIMRCFALGQICRAQGGVVTFLSFCDSNSLRQRILNEGFEFIPIEKPCPEPSDIDFVLGKISKINQQKPDDIWLVVDGYHFSSEYHRKIKEAGHLLLVVDDTAHLDYYDADIVLNQNINAKELEYASPPNTHLLLGSRYVLLRSEFIARRHRKRQMPGKVRHVLVTLGGADPDNLTLQIVSAFKAANIPDIELKVVVGPSNPNIELLKAAAAGKSSKIFILDSVRNMAHLMAWADVAVAAGGITCWELAFMGVPILVTVLAENQRLNAEGLERAGVAINLGENLLTPAILKSALEQVFSYDGLWAQMAEKGQELIDGKGSQRVLNAMAQDKFFLRKVRGEDCKLLWKWANEKEVRKWSFHSEPIAWRDHQKWFDRKLKDKNCFHFIAGDRSGNSLGQIRFDVTDNIAEAHITIDRNMRGSGIGSRLLRIAVEELRDLAQVEYVCGHVLSKNVVSIKAFEKAGFQKKGRVIIHGKKCIRFETKLSMK